MAYTGVFVFGDSLVDAGNALGLAEWYGDLTSSELPDGAPTAEQGYYEGRFTNGYTFADLLANKAIGAVTQPVFPYGYEDPWLGIPISPGSEDPTGNNLNFAYGGAQIRQGDEVVPDLDGQTDAFRDAVDGHADANALYLVTIGGNDVRSLAPTGSDPVPAAEAYAELDACAQELVDELTQLASIGVKNILITGIPDVGLVARYDADGNDILDPSEQLRADAATDYSQYLDMLIRTVVIPAVEQRGAVVTYVPIMDHIDEATGQDVTGALSANLQTLAVLNGIRPNEPGETAAQELSQNLLRYENVLFFDGLHPTAQAHALLGAYMHAQLNNSPWVENMPLLGADVDHAAAGSISAAGEVDQISVSMVADTTYAFQMLGVSSLTSYVLGQLRVTTPLNLPLLGDPSLQLLSPGGVTLGADNDSGAGFDSSLVHSASATGLYSLRLSAVGGLTGDYVFTATVTGAAMQVGNTYTVNSGSILVLEGAGGVGVDTVTTSVSYRLAGGSEIEVLQTGNAQGTSAISLTGNEFAQEIIGNAAANAIDGAAGADTMRGGAGDDSYYRDNVSDSVLELAGEGTDTVYSSVTYGLAANLEHLVLTGTAAINGFGNALNNTIAGNSAANVLNGRGGADAMSGGAGNDIYIVDHRGDTAVEATSAGRDQVRSSVSFTLGTNVENLILTGTSAINGTGNGLSNVITGNSAANLLNGGPGADALRGGDGNDTLAGGAGKDSLAGAAGLDQFLFNAALSASTNVDRITDFSVADDTIRLDDDIFTAAGPTGTLAASAFRAGTAAQDADDRIIYDSSTGRIYYDADGNGAGAQVLFAHVTAGLALTHADFLIVG